MGSQMRVKRTPRRGELTAPRAPAAPALLDPLPELQGPTRTSLKPSRVLDSLATRRAATSSQAVTAAPVGGSPQPCRLAAVRKEGTLSFARQRTDGEAYSLHAGAAWLRLLRYGERMSLLLPPRGGRVSSIRTSILLASATLGGTDATRLPAGAGAGQRGRCCGMWRGQRPARRCT